MGFIDKFKAGWQSAQQGNDIQNKLYKAVYSFFNGFFYTLATTKETFVKEGYQKNITVYSAVKMIASKVANARIYAYTYKNGEKVEFPIEHYANQILLKPNEFVRQQQFLEECASWMLITGDLFLYKLKFATGSNKGQTARIYTLPSQYVQIIGGGVFEPVRGYRMIIGDQSIEFTVDEIVHIKYFNPMYGISGEQLYGQSPLLAALNTIQSSNEGTLTKIKSFINGGVFGILSTKDKDIDLTVEQKADLQNFIDNRAVGSKNAKSIKATDVPLEFTQVGMSPADLEVLKSIEFDEQMICKSLGIDPILFSVDSATYNNKKEAYKALIYNVCVPLLNLLVDAYTDIIEDRDVYIGYDISHYEELQQDLKATIDALVSAYWLTPNEKLEIMGKQLSENELMNKYYFPNNLVPLDEISVNVDTDLKNYGDFR